MIKVNLEKNIVEMGGNTLDHINEVMIAAWEAANEYPQLKDKMKKMFNKVLDEKERPVLQSEKEFTNSMRELLGATNEPEEAAPLDEEDIEYLLRKITTIRDSDRGLSFVYYSDGNINVQIWHKDSPRAALRLSGEFYFKLHETGVGAKESRRVYEECTAYLEQLADK